MIVKRDPAFIQAYLEDSSNIKGGYADRVVIPENPDELSSVLKEANSKKTPVTVSGAGTGQAGGRIPFGGTVLSTERLNAVKEIRRLEKGGVASVEAGVTVRALKEECSKKGLFYTYDPTEQAAFVGGTIATNAKGARSYRYGDTRSFVRGLTLALADGSVLSLKRGENAARGRILEFKAGRKHLKIELPAYKMPRTKNSAGYYAKEGMDPIDLFIGQEGTLGVILEAELSLLDMPRGFFACFAFFDDEKRAWEFSVNAKCAHPISVEYFDGNSIELLREKTHNVPRIANAAVFFEDEIEKAEDEVLEKWEGLLSRHGVSSDSTWVSMNEKTHREFLDYRHFIPERMSEMAKRSGYPKISTDLAVPGEKLFDILSFYKSNLESSGLKHFIFGHIGDAHLHVNMLPSGERDYERAVKLRLEFVKKSISLGGTVSAEHGIGKAKREFLELLYGEKALKGMIKLKTTLDPNLILGRGNVLSL